MEIVAIKNIKDFIQMLKDVEWSPGFIFGGLPVALFLLPLLIAGWLFQVKDDPVAISFGFFVLFIGHVSYVGEISYIAGVAILLAARALVWLIVWAIDYNESRWIRKTSAKIELMKLSSHSSSK